MAEQRKRGGISSIQDVLDSYLKETGITKSRGIVARVFEAWCSSVGRELARRARPVRFRSGELTLEVESSALLHELASFTGEEYRRRTNQILGNELVHRTIYKHRG